MKLKYRNQQFVEVYKGDFNNFFHFISASLIVHILLSISAAGQQPQSSPAAPIPDAIISDDLIKIRSDLIQTSVSVYDQKGKFVNNLTTADFEFKVDGKIVPIAFFEANSVSRSSNEKSAATAIENFSPSTGNNGRVILFVVDDVHMSFESFKRTKDLILKFIDKEKKPEDLAAIVSSTGKIGFLQQFSNNETMLRAALGRLTAGRNYSATDTAPPPMTEFEAQEIDQNNKEVIDIFTEIILRDYPPESRTDPSIIQNVNEQVRSRAKNILQQGRSITKITYDGLEQALRLSGKISGRKTVFFFSDGFLLDLGNSNSPERINRIADAATRANAVINSIDSSGLDASLPEGTAASYKLQAGKRFSSLDALNLFAKNSGGKFIHNINDPQTYINSVLDESSSFYLLGWQPDIDDGKNDKLRQIQISVKGQPDLAVTYHNGYLNFEGAKSEDKKSAADKKSGSAKNSDKSNKRPPNETPDPAAEIKKAIFSQTPISGLPTILLIHYLDQPGEGGSINGYVQIDGRQVDVVRNNQTGTSQVELMGIIYDTDGTRIDYFDKLLSVDYSAAALAQNAVSNLTYNFQTKVKPGLYQIRIASRDLKSGRLGSNLQWVEIPDLSKGDLKLSTLLFVSRNKPSEIPAGDADAGKSDKDFAADKLLMNVGKIFDRSSFLQFKIYLFNYPNISENKGTSDPRIRVQIYSGSKIISEIPFKPAALDKTDPARIFYADETPLQSLSPGHYKLQFSIQTKDQSEIIQQETFEVK